MHNYVHILMACYKNVLTLFFGILQDFIQSEKLRHKQFFEVISMKFHYMKATLHSINEIYFKKLL